MASSNYPTLPTELWTTILRDATEIPGAHDTSYHDPFESHHLIHPLKPSGPYKGDYYESLRTKRSVVGVCRLWNIIATPYLYETVCLWHRATVSLLLRTVTETATTRQLGTRIFRLDIEPKEELVITAALESLLEECSNLKILHAGPETAAGNLGHLDWSSMFPSTPQLNVKAIIILAPHTLPSTIGVPGLVARFPNLDILAAPMIQLPPDPENDSGILSSAHTFGMLEQRAETNNPFYSEYNTVPSHEAALQTPSLRTLIINTAETPLLALPDVKHVVIRQHLPRYPMRRFCAEYNHLTTLTLDSQIIVPFGAFPHLERLAISNVTGQWSEAYNVVAIIKAVLGREGTRNVQVVRILEVHAGQGVNWLWPKPRDGSKMPRASRNEGLHWLDNMIKFMARGLRLENHNGDPFEPSMVPPI